MKIRRLCVLHRPRPAGRPRMTSHLAARYTSESASSEQCRRLSRSRLARARWWAYRRLRGGGMPVALCEEGSTRIRGCPSYPPTNCPETLIAWTRVPFRFQCMSEISNGWEVILIYESSPSSPEVGLRSATALQDAGNGRRTAHH